MRKKAVGSLIQKAENTNGRQTKTIMTIAIVLLLILGFGLVSTGHYNPIINKGAVAIFVGVLAWILYILNGTYYVSTEHAGDLINIHQNGMKDLLSIRSYIAKDVFSQYIFDACQIVFYLLATIGIVEVLNTNGCFDFISNWLRTPKARYLLWSLSFFAYFLSANLDNFTTVMILLTVMHAIVKEKKLRILYGAAILIATNCGGALTVIGNISSLTLWVKGAVTPTWYSAVLFLPTLIAFIIPVALIGCKLPLRIDVGKYGSFYEGNDSALESWQKASMLIVGIGGLWFIPTFHRLTMMPPFLGAFCVLSLLWVINELYNKTLFKSDRMVSVKYPITMLHSNVQIILFYIGFVLLCGAVKETGFFHTITNWCTNNQLNIYGISAFIALLSGLIDDTVITLTNVSIFEVGSATAAGYMEMFKENGSYWLLSSLCATLGGTCLLMGSWAGFAYMMIEDVSISWYVRHITGKMLLGSMISIFIYSIIDFCFL